MEIGALCRYLLLLTRCRLAPAGLAWRPPNPVRYYHSIPPTLPHALPRRPPRHKQYYRQRRVTFAPTPAVDDGAIALHLHRSRLHDTTEIMAASANISTLTEALVATVAKLDPKASKSVLEINLENHN